MEILAPDEPWAGVTRGEWDSRFWQWNFSLPDNVNPFTDDTGGRCGWGQAGPVFFLPGVETPGASFTCVVAEGTALYVLAAGAECSTVEPPPYFGRNEEELRACAAEVLDGTRDYKAHVNGHDVPDLEAYRVSSPLFTLTFPENNVIGVEPGVAYAVSEAYSFIIAPPPPGEYEIGWSAWYPDEPEPRSMANVRVIVEAPQVIEPPPPDTLGLRSRRRRSGSCGRSAGMRRALQATTRLRTGQPLTGYATVNTVHRWPGRDDGNQTLPGHCRSTARTPEQRSRCGLHAARSFVVER